MLLSESTARTHSSRGDFGTQSAQLTSRHGEWKSESRSRLSAALLPPANCSIFKAKTILGLGIQRSQGNQPYSVGPGVEEFMFPGGERFIDNRGRGNKTVGLECFFVFSLSRGADDRILLSDKCKSS